MNTLKIKHPSPAAQFETVDLMQKDAPDVQFEGKLLGEIDSRTVDTRGRKDADRYTRLELYELRSGKWIAAAVACSDRGGEVDIAKVTVIPTDRVEATLPDTTADLAIGSPFENARRAAVLEAFGWTWLAKAFADKMGWQHVQVLA